MKNRKELALIYLANARMYFDKIFNLLDREEEYNEIEEYYGTIEQYFDDLKHEIQNLQLYEPEAEDPTDRQVDEMILERLEQGK
mgnify:CR=1 FL=1